MDEGMCLQKIAEPDCIEDKEQNSNTEWMNHIKIHGKPAKSRMSFAGDIQQKLEKIEGT